jgi:CBS domain-containing protein
MSMNKFAKKDVVTVDRRATVTEAALKMKDRSVGCLVVLDKDNKSPRKPVGIVTDRDISLAVVAKSVSPDSVAVEDIMMRHPVTAKISEGLYQSILTMQNHGIKRLPLVDDHDNLVGIISSDDLTRFIAEEMLSLASITERQIQKERGGVALAERFN